MIKVTRIARAAARARLADPATGFNPLLIASMVDAGIGIQSHLRLPIDYLTPNSKNFFMADVAPEDFAATTAYTLPYQSLFAIDSTNQNLAKFHAFAGPVTLGVNTYITWPTSRALLEMEEICDCIEQSLVACFNQKAIAEWAMQADARLLYNGDFAFQRSRITRSSESWRQDLFARLTLEVFDAES